MSHWISDQSNYDISKTQHVGFTAILLRQEYQLYAIAPCCSFWFMLFNQPWTNLIKIFIISADIIEKI
jgi:hypothetical protein